MIIALDGPAASGKGTLARKLAGHLDLAYLDTGLLYRGVALAVLRAGDDAHDPEIATRAVRRFDPALLTVAEIRDETTSVAASLVAAVPAVRAALLDYQRQFAARPPAGKRGAVLDGRDIGTVVCPDASRKIFVTADLKIRAERRYKELQARGEPVIYETVLEDLRDRDARDATRHDAPMCPASDAFVLDTTALDPDQAFESALSFVTTGTVRTIGSS